MPGPDAQRFGAFHPSEVPYALNILYRSNRSFTEADRRIADLMSSCWANFSTSGDPNGKGLPPWPIVRGLRHDDGDRRPDAVDASGGNF
jgi:para-nitrobenzyl esterase